jgi:hypothetical protein
MYQLPTAPRGIGQVIDSIFKLFRASFTSLVIFAFIGGLISIVPIIYMLWSGALDEPLAAGGLGMMPGYWISILCTVPLTLIIYGAAIARGESVAQGRKISLGAALGRGLSCLLTMLIASILFGLCVAVGMVLLIIPGLILMLSLLMYQPAIVLDGKGMVESLKYSHGLVWGNWWRTAAVFSIAIIIIYVLFLLIGVAAGLVFVAVGFDTATVFIVQAVTTLLTGFLVTPFFVSLYLEVYRDLKMRKEGGDLAARIEAVGTAR